MHLLQHSKISNIVSTNHLRNKYNYFHNNFYYVTSIQYKVIKLFYIPIINKTIKRFKDI